MVEHKQISSCYCGMNIYNVYGYGSGAIPCNCDRLNPESFYYDSKFKILCSKCGLSIPYGEKYNYTYPVCEGCSCGVEDDLEDVKELPKFKFDEDANRFWNEIMSSYTLQGKTAIMAVLAGLMQRESWKYAG